MCPDPNTETPLEQVSAEDMMTIIKDAIEELPDLQRQSLVLFSIEKIPQREVAKMLDCTVEMVKWNVFDARRRLRKKLGKLNILKEQ